MITVLNPSEPRYETWQRKVSTQPFLSRLFRNPRPDELVPVGPIFVGRVSFGRMLVLSTEPLPLWKKFDHEEFQGVMPMEDHGDGVYLCTVDCIKRSYK